MIRIAETTDIPLIVQLGMKFINTTDYKHLASEGKIQAIAEDIISSGTHKKVIFLCEDYGMLVGIKVPFTFGLSYVAAELAWWVDEDKRNTGAGQELLEAFEIWAKAIECSCVTMVSLDERVGAFYEKRGYKLYERTYMKEI